MKDKTAAERAKRYRDGKKSHSVTEISKSVTDTTENVTAIVTAKDIVLQELTEHPILKFLVDKDQRVKMESIVSHLKDKNLLNEVRFGLGNRSLTMEEVAGCLEVT